MAKPTPKVSTCAFWSDDYPFIFEMMIGALYSQDEKTAQVDELNRAAYDSRNNDVPGSIEKSREAVRLADECNYDAGKARALCNLGFGNLQLSKLDEALENLNAAADIFHSLKDEDGTAAVLYNFGIIFLRLGNLTRALDSQHKSLAIREAINNFSGAGNCLFQVAFIQHRFKEYDAAIEQATRGLDYFRKAGDRFGQAAQHMILGMSYSDKNEAGKAISHFQESINIRKEVNDPKGHGTVLYALGNHYLKSGEPLQAQKYFSDGRKIAIAQRDRLAQARIRIAFCELYIKQDFLEKAGEEIDAGIQMAEENNLKSLLPDLFRNKAELEEKRGNYREALAAFKNYQLATQEVYSAEAAMKLKHNDLLRKMEAASMEAEINHLKNVELKKAYDEIEQKNKDITDSINYARRIQYALLAHDELLQNNLPEHFVLFRPKDIVSGDFYWATKKKDWFYLAVCDSTGHGVPGAFMSLLNISFLNEAINEENIERPCDVLDHVRGRLIENISQDGAQDGMDGILIRYAHTANGMYIEYAAANNAPVLVRDGVAACLPGDKMPVGKSLHENRFSHHAIDLHKGDTVYLFTDGLADQFGGPKGKKLKYKNLITQLEVVNALPGEKCREKLGCFFDEWKGTLEQVDDVCLIGLKF